MDNRKDRQEPCEHVVNALDGGLLVRSSDGAIAFVGEVPGRFMYSVLYHCPWCGECLAADGLGCGRARAAEGKLAILKSSVGHVPMEKYTRLLTGLATAVQTLEDVMPYGELLPKTFRSVIYSVINEARTLIADAA